MVQYLLVGLIFYLISVLANASIAVGWKERTMVTALAAVTFIIFWFPIFVVFIYLAIEKKLRSR